MKKTYVTTMPDKAGAFLKACECFAELNINITRVSYNKAVDTHTLFIEAEGSPKQFDAADAELNALGYIADSTAHGHVMLLEFKLDDHPGALVKILRLIEKHGFNISYISSQENGLGYQPFRMGLFVEDSAQFTRFMKEAEEICAVTNIAYDNTEVSYDNSIFYHTYVDTLARNANMPASEKPRLAVYVNRAMQLLDQRNLSPKTAFDSIAKFAALLTRYKGENFNPRITTIPIAGEDWVTVIEPPCGGNTTILKSGDDYLFIDSGYAIYREEMVKLFDKITGGFDKIQKNVVLTHADLDHAGLLDLFDRVYTSDKSKKSLELDHRGKRDFREQNPLHIPYIKICKLLTAYRPPNPEKITAICSSDDTRDEPLYKTGTFAFGNFSFDVYYGQGGHLQGEIALVEQKHRLIFSGDIYVNLKDYIPEQAEYNRYAPILMTSVDTTPALAKLQRNALLALASDGEWTIFGGHGAPKTINSHKGE